MGQNPWLISHAGASCVKSLGGNNFEIIVSGRDFKNRSALGQIILNLEGDNFSVEVNSEPLLTHGEIGCFDEAGVSYPSLITNEKGDDFLFYTGWMLTVLSPFQNQLGLAIRTKGSKDFKRFSRAPIMDRNNEDCTSIGSTAVLRFKDNWKMWYTGFGEWSEVNDKTTHSYCIKYADSKDGISWNRENLICIKNDKTFNNVAKPTVIYDESNECYHMWFCYRGDEYKIGYANSKDGKTWIRDDESSRFSPSGQEWDAYSQCYPFVFKHQDSLYLIHSGNNYGKGGLGISRMKLL